MDACVVKGYDSAIAAYDANGVVPKQLSLPMFDGYRDTEKYRIILSTLKLDENAAPITIYAAYYALKDLGEFGHADQQLQDKKYTWWLLNNHRFSNSGGYYFEMEDKKISFGLPEQSVYYFDNQVTYNIKDTTYYHILTDQSPRAGFKFNFTDETIVELYCFKDGSVHTLFRQY